jgi:hypothetical protein
MNADDGGHLWTDPSRLRQRARPRVLRLRGLRAMVSRERSVRVSCARIVCVGGRSSGYSVRVAVELDWTQVRVAISSRPSSFSCSPDRHIGRSRSRVTLGDLPRQIARPGADTRPERARCGRSPGAGGGRTRVVRTDRAHTYSKRRTMCACGVRVCRSGTIITHWTHLSSALPHLSGSSRNRSRAGDVAARFAELGRVSVACYGTSSSVATRVAIASSALSSAPWAKRASKRDCPS